MPGVDSPGPIARVGGAGSRARQDRVLHRLGSPARGVPGLKHRGRIRSANGRRHNVKVIVLMPRRADMSPEDFKQHLRETHLP
jgi:hypothetical protein